MNHLAIYLHLARAAMLRRQPLVQVRLLVLSAIVAYQLKMPRICAACRSQILDSNPNHMIRRWPTIDAALDDPDFRHFLRQIERRYPHEKAESMMAELEIVRANERDAYYTDEEYAASLLGLTAEALDQFGEPEPRDEI